MAEPPKQARQLPKTASPLGWPARDSGRRFHGAGIGRLRASLGAAVGFVGLLLSLTTVDLLLFYFEQFSTIITTMLQFLLLFGIGQYRRRLRLV